MNTFSDAVTIGIVITLVFGALFFYLYSRQVQNEKRVSLIENILLDLKMSADANQSWGSANWGLEPHEHEESRKEESQQEPPVNHVEPVSGPEPLASDDLDTSDEDVYREVLEQAPEEMKSFEVAGSKSGSPKTSNTVSVTKVQPNYASMTAKELKSLAKQRGLTFPNGAGKKEITDALRKQDGGAKEEVVPAEPQGFLGNQDGAFLDAEAETL